MALRVYLDTSVFSARFDERAPERMRLTEEFFARLREFEPATSSLAREELEDTPDPQLRTRLLTSLQALKIHETTQEMRELGQRYEDAGVFTGAMSADALHVAAAVFLRQDVLASWNFRHLVNRRRRSRINDLNCLWGLPMIEIVAPPEL